MGKRKAIENPAPVAPVEPTPTPVTFPPEVIPPVPAVLSHALLEIWQRFDFGAPVEFSDLTALHIAIKAVALDALVEVVISPATRAHREHADTFNTWTIADATEYVVAEVRAGGKRRVMIWAVH